MKRTKTLIAILAAAALTLGMVPQLASAAAPAAPQDHPIDPEDADPCGNAQLPQQWNGFIQLATPSVPGSGLTVTELFTFLLAERAPVPLAQSFYNGVDAYVRDLNCVVETEGGTETSFCVTEDEAPEGERLLFELQYGNLEDPNFSVAYLDDDQRVAGVDDDPTDCEDFPQEAESVPEDTRYVVLYVDEAFPKGVQADASGIYSTYFCAQVGQLSDPAERC